jgi:LEA14-like dessication related protein
MRVSHTSHIGPWKAEPGESYLVMDLKVKNPNPETVTHDAEFQVLDSEGTIRDRDPRLTNYAKNGFFFEFTIKPKSSKPITVVFKVPEERLNQIWTLQIQNKDDKLSPGMVKVGSAAKTLAQD